MARGALADNLAALNALSALSALSAKGVVSGVVARERTLPVLPAFADLLPHGAIQRGSVIGCHGAACVSLALALAAGPSREGAWVGIAGLPHVGVAAAVELGVAPERLVLVAEPVATAQSMGQRFDDARWAEVLAAMIDGFDVLVLGPGTQRVHTGTARRLMARLQARGAVAIVVGHPAVGQAAPQRAGGPFGADLTLHADGTEWAGLGHGHGVARGRRSVVQVAGRRVPRPRRTHLWLPTAEGCVATVQQQGAVVPLRPTG